MDPLKDLVTLISKGIDGQRDPTAKQFNTILLLQLPAIFLTPPHFENDANKSKANEAIKQQINTFIQSKQLPSIQERCVDPTSHIQKSKAAVFKAHGKGNATLDNWNVIFIQKAVQDGNIGRAANGFVLQALMLSQKTGWIPSY